MVNKKIVASTVATVAPFAIFGTLFIISGFWVYMQAYEPRLEVFEEDSCHLDNSCPVHTCIYVDVSNIDDPSEDGSLEHPFDKIQEGVNAADTGNIIRVANGTYYEAVTIDKSISLIGESRNTTVIDGNETGTIVHVEASGVNLTGFTIKNSGHSSDTLYDPFCGVLLSGGSNSLINGNILLDNQFGIQVFWGSNHTITSNMLTNNTYGIYMVYSTNVRFRNNSMSRNIYNFGVWGYSRSAFTHDIDTSNIINESPVYYLVNQNNVIVDPHKFSSLGYLAIINSVNVTVKNCDLKNNFQGVLFAFVAHSTIENINVSNNAVGICLISSGDNIVKHVFSSNNGDGIYVLGDGNRLIDNTITSNNWGVYIWASKNNIITGNTISNNSVGVRLGRNVQSSVVHQNNFVSNKIQAYVADIHSINVWDGGYLSGGNYWSDYEEGYPNRTELDGLGKWSIPYVIDGNNLDNYPLITPTALITRVFVTHSIRVKIHSNSSISTFQFNSSIEQLSFNVTGSNGTTGFCNVSIPDDLLWGEFFVYKDDFLLMKDVDYTQVYNCTHYTFYFTYVHTTHAIKIEGTEAIPELPSFLILPLFMISTLLAAILYRRKHSI